MNNNYEDNVYKFISENKKLLTIKISNGKIQVGGGG